jgi:hypothetical protein
MKAYSKKTIKLQPNQHLWIETELGKILVMNYPIWKHTGNGSYLTQDSVLVELHSKDQDKASIEFGSKGDWKEFDGSVRFLKK